MIEVNGLIKRFNDTPAVEDPSFEIKPGQITGFHRSHGAGKSTTLRIIMGLDAPDAGLSSRPAPSPP